MNAKFLADKTCVVLGHFPEIGGGDQTALGMANIKAIIESFGGKEYIK